MMRIIFLIVGIVIWVFYLKEKIKAYTPKAVLLKALVSFMFVMVAVSSYSHIGAGLENRFFGAYIIGGLLCGLLGDIWLDLKFVYPQHDEFYTYCGFSVFGVGHIFFIIGMIRSFADISRIGYIVIPIIIAIILGIVNGSIGRLMKLEYGTYKPVVMAYGSILFAMLLIAGSLAMMNGFSNHTLNMMFIGGVLFAISDIVLSGTYFGEGKERPIDFILNYVTYYGAQFIIALSIAFLG